MPEDMKDAPELVVPAEFEKRRVPDACPPEVNELYTRIWTVGDQVTRDTERPAAPHAP